MTRLAFALAILGVLCFSTPYTVAVAAEEPAKETDVGAPATAPSEGEEAAPEEAAPEEGAAEEGSGEKAGEEGESEPMKPE